MPTRKQASPYSIKSGDSDFHNGMTAISFSFLLDVYDDRTQVTKLFNNITDYWQKK